MDRSLDSKAVRRLDRFRRVLAHVREDLSLDVGFRLWDGSAVPADLPPDALTVVIADEGVVASVVRRPNIDTLLNLWVTARIDILGGRISDLIARRPILRTREIVKRLDKGLVLSTAAAFAVAPRGGPWPLEALRRGQAPASGGEEANKANVHYHYDVSNAFYALFLDPEMVYSCGYFADWDNDLATAQRDKLDMICRKLRLKPGETLLDIGCGWGGLACHAAQHYGVRVHGVTLAEEQLAYAKEKVARLGLEDRVRLELRDYARIEDTYDKVASIGMFEHVGLANHPAFFRKIERLLKPGGLYLHHAIALRWKTFATLQKKKTPAVKALDRYIFPGGELDHIGMTVANLERYGFEVHDVEAWREHYALTTRLWHDRLFANREAAAREVGWVKTRLWLAYLDGVSIGFRRGTYGIFQTLASKRTRGASAVPSSRADLYR